MWRIAVLIGTLCLGCQPMAKADDLAGYWEGALDVGGAKLVLGFHIDSKDGKYTCKVDSVTQGAMGLPTDSVTIENGAVTIEMKALSAKFEGKISDDKKQIVGEWKQAGTTLPLTIVKKDKPAELKRPQMPKKPYPYHEEDVTYENKAQGNKIAGTFTRLNTNVKFPVVLLITGSGAQDRDESLLGHKPFLVLADYLTRRGIAVLRVDDRGVGGSTGDPNKATSADFATDVLAGVEYLKTRKDIDPKRIGLIGHSEGGMIAPMVAVKTADVAYIVLMAGTGLTGEQILKMQTALISKAAGAPEEKIKENEKNASTLYEAMKAGADEATLREKLEALIKFQAPTLSDADRKTAVETQARVIGSPWFRYFLTYDPAPTMKKVKCPVLAINGELDLQVPPKEDLAAIETALKSGGNTNYTIKEFPKLNHLFQTAKTGSPAEYATIEETMAPQALETIAKWILKVTTL
jgi:pimeloyl-ACP methyl ester carboxylesterase